MTAARTIADRDAIVAYCDERLRAVDFADAAINGLQVAGSARITKLAVAVSASRFTLESAASWGAEALLVHHGLLWGAKLGPLTGTLGERLRILFQSSLNLIAYHLPLDGHAEIGNCALLAASVGYSPVGRFAYAGREPLGVIGERDPALTVDRLVSTLEFVTDHLPTVVGDPGGGLACRRVGFLTGSGYSAVDDAARRGCQVLVTGDIRESTMAEAREAGIAVVAAGHEATERFGVQALAQELSERFGIETRYIADPNPI